MESKHGKEKIIEIVVTWEINDCLFPMLKKLFYFLLSFIPISIYYYNISILCLLLN